MLLPIRTDSPLRTTPWMNWGIILLNIAVFLLARRDPAAIDPYLLSARDPALADYFTYSLFHGGIWHLLGNMLFLYIFGNNVNDKLGHAGYLGFYLAGGVFAGIGHVLTQSTFLYGASGAVAAVTGAYLMLLPRSNVTIIYLLFFVGTFEVPGMWFVALFFIKELLLPFTADRGGGGASDIAHFAHISGALFGAGLCLGLLAVQLLPRDQFDVLALMQRWNKRRQYRELVSKGYDPFGYLPKVRPEPLLAPAEAPDPSLQRMQDLRAEISEALAHHNHPHAPLLFQELIRLDPQQVLSRQAQLEVANQLASQQLYEEAADAYEQFMTHYGNFEQVEQVELMLGLIYARYLRRYDRAKELLLRAAARLHGEREVEMARAELRRIEPLVSGPTNV
jgi:membrane associated rhomboid family serine protease